MAIFSEIYGVYFRAAEKILRCKTFTRQQVLEAINKYGFRESSLFLPQKLIPQKDGSDWGLLRENENGTLSPAIKNAPVSVLTALQKRWSATMLNDPKWSLFMDEETVSALKKHLSGTQLLYENKDIRYTDRFNDGDDFSDIKYRRNFRSILAAVKAGEIIGITFLSGKNKKIIRLRVLPLKIEYSAKNDKFRLLAATMRKNKFTGRTVVNIGRITSVRRLNEFPGKPVCMERFFAGYKAKEPVKVRITNERNAVERFLVEFASYEKHTEQDIETGTLTAELTYDKTDETELLIQLLSFGPVIEILGPPHFRQMAAERVHRQYDLLFGSRE